MAYRVGLLLVGMLISATLAGWSAMAGLQAKQCLDGQLPIQLEGEWRGAGIAERGCEVTMASGEVVVVPISGPSFETGVASALVFVVSSVSVLVMLDRRLGRRDRRDEPLDSLV